MTQYDKVIQFLKSNRIDIHRDTRCAMKAGDRFFTVSTNLWDIDFWKNGKIAYPIAKNKFAQEALDDIINMVNR